MESIYTKIKDMLSAYYPVFYLNSFEYTLEGFDQSWNRMQGKHITYTNLPPGNYTLKVRPVISGKGQVKEACLNIHVAPPFYASTWAYLLK